MCLKPPVGGLKKKNCSFWTESLRTSLHSRSVLCRGIAIKLRECFSVVANSAAHRLHSPPISFFTVRGHPRYQNRYFTSCISGSSANASREMVLEVTLPSDFSLEAAAQQYFFVSVFLFRCFLRTAAFSIYFPITFGFHRLTKSPLCRWFSSSDRRLVCGIVDTRKARRFHRSHGQADPSIL